VKTKASDTEKLLGSNKEKMRGNDKEDIHGFRTCVVDKPQASDTEKLLGSNKKKMRTCAFDKLHSSRRSSTTIPYCKTHLRPCTNNLTPQESSCNLMLGMIYCDFNGLPEMIADSKGGTPQLRRDTARCVSTEIYFRKEIYTLDNREGTGISHREDRHMVQNLGRIDLDHPLMIKIRGHVDQICLDYFWFVGGYWGTKLKKVFYTQSLPRLHDLLRPGGSIYLGLSVHLLLAVLRHQRILQARFHISLVHETKVEEIELVSGSQKIPEGLYADIMKFGAKPQNPERDRGTTRQAIREGHDSTTGDVKYVFAQLKKMTPGVVLEECRFIKLRKRS
jgi:hypothetical protein